MLTVPMFVYRMGVNLIDTNIKSSDYIMSFYIVVMRHPIDWSPPSFVHALTVSIINREPNKGGSNINQSIGS